MGIENLPSGGAEVDPADVRAAEAAFERLVDAYVQDLGRTMEVDEKEMREYLAERYDPVLFRFPFLTAMTTTSVAMKVKTILNNENIHTVTAIPPEVSGSIDRLRRSQETHPIAVKEDVLRFRYFTIILDDFADVMAPYSGAALPMTCSTLAQELSLLLSGTGKGAPPGVDDFLKRWLKEGWEEIPDLYETPSYLDDLLARKATEGKRAPEPPGGLYESMNRQIAEVNDLSESFRNENSLYAFVDALLGLPSGSASAAARQLS